jgi:PAS domain-containing protein
MSNNNGQLTYLRELTEQLTTRDAELWERDKLVKLVFDNSPASIVMWAVDTELIFTLSAGQGLKKLGLKANESVGISLFEYFETADENFQPIAAHIKALKGTPNTYDFEFMDCVWHTHCTPLLNDLGIITGVTGCAFDITCYIEQAKKIKKLESIIECKETCSTDKYEAIKKLV